MCVFIFDNFLIKFHSMTSTEKEFANWAPVLISPMANSYQWPEIIRFVKQVCRVVLQSFLPISTRLALLNIHPIQSESDKEKLLSS